MADYDFRTLSPLDFEVFVRDLLSAHEQRTYRSYGAGRDDGIDLQANDVGTNLASVVQCKHRPDLAGAGLLRILKSEAAGWSHREQPDRYLLATSAAISPRTEAKARIALESLPVPADGIWHRGSLNAALARHPEVERQHFNYGSRPPKRWSGSRKLASGPAAKNCFNGSLTESVFTWTSRRTWQQ